MSQPELSIEFQTDVTTSELDLYTMIEDRLNRLAKGHTDIIGASATLEQPAANRTTPYIFQASIVVFMRPNYIRATEMREAPELALRGALDAIERQVREERARLRDSQRQPGDE